MNATVQTTLVSVNELCQVHKLGAPKVIEYLRDLQPLHTAKVGGAGIAKFYDRKAADAAILAGVEGAKAAAAAPLRPLDDLFGIRLAHIEEAVADILVNTERMDEDRALFQKLLDQNALIFKAINDLRAAVNAVRPTAPATAAGPGVGVASPPTAAVPPPNAPAPAPAPLNPVLTGDPLKRPLPKVAIVGLLKSQAHMIEKEFHECFDLRIYQSEDAKGRAFENAIGQCDHVLAMTSFINHGIEALLRAGGKKLIRVHGGMTSLRDRLTTLFVETAGEKEMTS